MTRDRHKAPTRPRHPPPVPTESGRQDCRCCLYMFIRIGEVSVPVPRCHPSRSGFVKQTNRSRTGTGTRPPHPPNPSPCPYRIYPIRSAKIIRIGEAGLPMLFVHVHQNWGRIIVDFYVSLALLKTKRCITSSHKSSSRSLPWRISGCSGLCRIYSRMRVNSVSFRII